MDSMDLEREKGITIKAKNTSVHWKDKTINIVDTPGHADFGGEVERALRMVDGVLLLVDAYDGPQAQTRFVLRKALAARPEGHHRHQQDRPRELASRRRCTTRSSSSCSSSTPPRSSSTPPSSTASGRDGYMMTQPRRQEEGHDAALPDDPRPRPAALRQAERAVPHAGLQHRLERLRRPDRRRQDPRRQGRGRRHRVRASATPTTAIRAKITKVFEFTGLGTAEAAVGTAGNIVGLVRLRGHRHRRHDRRRRERRTPCPSPRSTRRRSRCSSASTTGRSSGREGKLVTSRQLRDRLFRELKTNVSIKVEDTDTAGVFNVKARGAMQIAVLVETMRREGFELLVSRPTVIEKIENGQRLEPYRDRLDRGP